MGIKSAGYWTRTSSMLCSPLLPTIITFFVIAVHGQDNGEEIVGFANHTLYDVKLAPNTAIADSKTFNLDVYKNGFPKSCDVYFTDDYM
jgi:hypothetical protein